MPMTVGLLSSQQESFDQHEELSKLLNETEVFYVPLRNDFNQQQDLSDLTKRFDEDILNKHLVVTFRDIGYSLFLDSVQSIPDQNDQSKTRVSGKMIVDGICIQFLGRFDCHHPTQVQSDVQQINGVGRVILDEDYYRELASNHISIDLDFSNDKSIEQLDHFETLPVPSMDQMRPTIKTRSRTISENLPGKSHSHVIATSPSSSRTRLHSPSHMPYPLRSPRTMTHMTKQQQASSPVNIDNLSVSRSSGFHSAFISPSSSNPSSYTDNPLATSPPQNLLQYSSPISFKTSTTTGTMPIQIPSSNSNLPTASLPQLTSIFPNTHSHSLPTYIFPSTNFTYLTSGSTTTTNTNMFLITNPNSHTLQPIHILAPIDAATSQFSNTQHTISPVHLEFSVTKTNSTTENNKQTKEQLPFKKRRYTGQPSPMDLSHFDDDDGSNDSMKK